MRAGALLLASVMMAGLIGAASAQGGRRGGTLRAALDFDPPTLDPHRSGTVVDLQANLNIDQSTGAVTGTLTGRPTSG